MTKGEIEGKKGRSEVKMGKCGRLEEIIDSVSRISGRIEAFVDC